MLGCCLQHWHPIETPIEIPAVSLLIQLSAKVPEEQQQLAQVPGFLAPRWETQWSSWILALAGPRPGHCSHMESELTDLKGLFLGLSCSDTAF